MIPRVLEPEAMDSPAEAIAYDAMDHAEVNARFVADFLEVHDLCRGGEVLDVGTGPARIPIALCRADPLARVLGIDLARSMLDLAAQNLVEAGLTDRVRLVEADAKGVNLPAGSFEAVLSNTIIHHIPDPRLALAELPRLVAPGGTLFVRDLIRPESEAALAALVTTHAGSEGPAARALFAESLRAALTIVEVRAIVKEMGLPAVGVRQTSDRHWTWIWSALLPLTTVSARE
ncbi:MAG: class I SAM-dependent methyltransferase [Isosphaeraceae bacterium]